MKRPTRAPYDLISISDADWKVISIGLPDDAKAELIEAASLYRATLQDGSKVLTAESRRRLKKTMTLAKSLKESLAMLAQSQNLMDAVQCGLNGQRPTQWNELRRLERALKQAQNHISELQAYLDISSERVVKARAPFRKHKAGNLRELIGAVWFIIQKYLGPNAAYISKGRRDHPGPRKLIDYLCIKAAYGIVKINLDTVGEFITRNRPFAAWFEKAKLDAEQQGVELEGMFTRDTLPSIFPRRNLSR